MVEARWTVTVADDRITVCDIDGVRRDIALADIGGVAVETNDSGPWGADLWWMLFDADDLPAVT